MQQNGKINTILFTMPTSKTYQILIVILIILVAFGSSFSELPNTQPIESNCAPCGDDQFQCKDCQCIMKTFVCDHQNDCFDKSDEPETCKSTGCQGEEFRCRNEMCIPHSWLCDGSNDCTDNSDEIQCADVARSCSKSEYLCPSTNQCMSLSKLCGGYTSCDYHKDMMPPDCATYMSNFSSCRSTGHCLGGPEYLCSLQGDSGTGVAVVCTCRKGYKVNEEDTSKCIDYNECEEYGRCDQKCVNTPGGYHCLCGEGYRLTNQRTCTAITSEEPWLYIASEYNITKMSLHGLQPSLVASGSIRDFDIHVATDTVFYIDENENKVYQTTSGGENVTEIVLHSVPKPCGLAYDWVGKNLYIVDCLAKRIALYNIERKLQKNVINDGIQNCKAIAVDSNTGFLFYSDFGRKPRLLPRIVRAFMDGSSVTDLKMGKILSPTSISLDIAARRIYWTDSKLDVIETATYDGLYRTRVLAGSLKIPGPISLAVFENQIYWADVTKMAVLNVGKFDPVGQVEQIWRTKTEVRSIRIGHSVLQTHLGRGSDPCRNSVCEQLCILTHVTDNDGLGYRCMCEAGYRLGPNRISCQSIEEFIIFATKHSVRAIPLDGTTTHAEDAMRPVAGLTNTRRGNSFVAVDYDASRKELYFSDIYNRAIFKTPIGNTDIQHVLANDIRSVEGISLDWISRNLYFTDFFAKTVSVIRLDHPGQRRVLLTGLGSPRSVVVHPARGYVFFADWLKDANNFPFIGRCHGDGSHMTKIHRYELGWPNGMCVDYDHDRVYWVDAYFDRLQHTDLDGNDLQTVQGIKIVHPFGVAVFRGNIYLTDWKLQTITRISMPAGVETVLLKGVELLRSLRIYSKDLQKVAGDHPCATNNGGCSHFCFPIPDNTSTVARAVKRQCGCPFGMKLAKDGHGCEENSSEKLVTECSGPTQFLCKSGRCISSSYKCDGENDCMDNSDQDNCPKAADCSADKFRCENGKCLSYVWKCDGDDDCGDMSDESQCPNKQCKPQEFKCNNTLCIHIRLKCNSENDCIDGSDEGDFCEDHVCQPGHYQCSDKRCISDRLVCDGEEDCYTGEDEKGCPPLKCPAESWLCTGVRQCVPIQYRCDGALDCRDKSDEDNCTVRPASCFLHEFKCTTGGCIPEKWKCDGQPDCADSTDESFCDKIVCADDQFQCKNRKCIPLDLVCDGLDQCGDNSDEDQSQTCAPPPFVCPLGEWECPGETVKCINSSLVCDGKEDCPGGLDESIMCERNDCMVDNGRCSWRCVQTPRGAECVCPEGERLNGTRICVDINECEDPTVCSQMCVNTKGSYMCKCHEGYYHHNTGCSPGGAYANIVVAAVDRQLVFGDPYMPAHSFTFEHLPEVTMISGIDVYMKEEKLFFSDNGNKKIYSSSKNGSNLTEVIPFGIEQVNDIAVDWIGGNIYWVDTALQILEVARLDGSNRMALFSENLTRPYSIELDPRQEARYLFWNDQGQSPRIERSGMDGFNRTIIVSRDLKRPTGLSIDYPNRRLYFADSKLETLEFCNYDGSGRRAVRFSNHISLVRPNGIVMFGDMVIWKNHGYKEKIEIMQCNKYNCTTPYRNQNHLYGTLRGITVFHPVRQPDGVNPCEAAKCSHLCLLSPSRDAGYICACPKGMNPSKSAPNLCVEAMTNFLVYSHEAGLSALQIPVIPGNESYISLIGRTDMIGLDFDSIEKKIFFFWRIPYLLSAKRIFLNSYQLFSSKMITESPDAEYIGTPSALAYDWISKNLFWTDDTLSTIEVKRMNSMYRKILLSNMGRETDCVKPVALTIDPVKGILFWADVGGNGIRPKLASMFMDGSRRTVLHQRKVDTPTSISRDVATNDLYWTEGRKQQILKYELLTKKVTVILREGNPNSVVFFDGVLYFADNNLETLNSLQPIDGGNVTVLKRNVVATKAMIVFRDQTVKGDSNGCRSNNGGCAQLCLPTGPATFVCECGVGYVINGNETCAPSESFILVSFGKYIRGFSLDRGDHDDAIAPIGTEDIIHDKAIMTIDVHIAGKYIYLVQTLEGNTAINRIHPDGRSVEQVITSGKAQAVAVDWIAGNLYYCDVGTRNSSIQVSRLDGSYQLLLLEMNGSPAADLAVNPIKRYLYWYDNGSSPKIELSYLDGSGRMAVITNGVVKPSGITIDITTHDVYWADSAVDAIQKMNYLGKDRQFVRSNVPHPIGLSVLLGSIYWMDSSQGAIYRADKDDPERPAKVLKGGLQKLMAIAIFDKALQPNVSNPCSKNNGGCEHLCFALPNNSKPVCKCSFGALAANNRSCPDVPPFVIYLTGEKLNSVFIDRPRKEVPFPPKASLLKGTPYDIDYDYKQNLVFYTDKTNNAVLILNLTSGVSRKLEEYKMMMASDNLYHEAYTHMAGQALTYDWIEQRIYWTDNDGVRSMYLNGTDLQTTLTGYKDSIKSLAVNPCNRFLFYSGWPDGGRLVDGGFIKRSDLDGSSQTLLIKKDRYFKPAGLVIDYMENTMYYVNIENHRRDSYSIIYCDFNGRTIMSYSPRGNQATSFGLYGKSLYYANAHELYKVDKASYNEEGSHQLVELVEKKGDIQKVVIFRDRSDACQVSTSCANKNGGCSELCTNNKDGHATCACFDPGSFVLARNGKSCQPKNSTCRDEQFTCLDGKCISLAVLCNGKSDCAEKEDENEYFCAKRECVAGFYRCASGQCIPDSYTCDHDRDCPDGDDEDPTKCLWKACLGVRLFQCKNGRCIDEALKCNGVDNCRDVFKSDETDCPAVNCSAKQTKCPTSNRCIQTKHLCDGRDDCGDMSDEFRLFCLTMPCETDEVRCKGYSRCIPKSWICDGESDCPLSSDELNCEITKEVGCVSGHFRCANHKCIPRDWVCDGYNDCGDYSDEKTSLHCGCPADWFRCNIQHLAPLPPNPCIPTSRVCDGNTDCLEGEDEKICTKPTCSPDEFTCRSGLCIPKHLRCDHTTDCSDGSDEGMSCEYSVCKGNEFMCDGQKCIPGNWVCDQEADCVDFSDESNATCRKEVCRGDQFQCRNGRCIDQSAVCNTRQDCDDWSDEINCGKNECLRETDNFCSQKCVDHESGYRCACRVGYKLLNDTFTCIDIDECLSIPGACSQLCTNTEGNFTCECNPGYQLESDGRRCKRLDKISPWLVFTNQYYIREITPDGENYQKVADDFGNAVALDILYDEQILYFTDVTSKQIKRLSINGTIRDTVVDHGILSPEGLSVDFIGRKLYWIDAKNVAMYVSELNGTNIKTLLQHEILRRPRALVLNPSTGVAFWTDWSKVSYIGSIGLDGSNPKMIITRKLGWPNALTMDYETNRLWWADAHLDWIEYANVDGSNRHVVKRDVPHPFAIAVFEDWVYWTDWNHLTIEKCNKYTGENHTILLNVTHRPMDIHVFHPLKQKPGINPCGAQNGGCSHLCLLQPGGKNFSCACPDRYILNDDLRTCRPNCSSTQVRCGPTDDRCIPRIWQCDGSRDCKDGADEPNTCPAATCSTGQFRCRNLKCVYGFQTCDLVDQCDDGSDEEGCEDHECESWQFRCQNHKCIPSGWKCDAFDDCGDGSDEAVTICHKRKCDEDKFMCDNGRCIPLPWQCDFDDDCGDNSDEKPEFGCYNRTCKQGWWKCHSNYRCIPDWQRCNGKDDCRDNSDEEIINCPKCHPTGDFTCANKRCVPKRWMCDFDNDCGDRSDEDPSMCAPLYRQCSETEIRCKNQKCIRRKWLCDHDNDCGDNSDEEQCTIPMVCHNNQFRCDTGHCIDKSFLCDGDAQCPDLSDEKNCSGIYRSGRICADDKFQCDNNFCVPLSWRCDGDDDCGDQSDESKTSCDQVTCSDERHIRCGNGKCIKIWQVCSNITQCDHLTDAELAICHLKNKSVCSPDQFKCADGACVPGSSVCNNVKDCNDASDEIGCVKIKGQSSCAVNNGGCEHNCTEVKEGFFCSCWKGFKVSKTDGKTCEDIDECATYGHGCPQLCNNVKGSFKCQCVPGFKDVKGQGHDCKPEEISRSLFFSTLTEIRRFQPDRKEYSGAVTVASTITSMDIDVGKSLLYWTDSKKGVVLRAPIPDKPDRQGLPQSIGVLTVKPHAVAVDWVENNIYWSDTKLGSISVCLFDGRYQKTVISNLAEPLALAVNPKLGLLYWTDGDIGYPRIERSWMNGENRVILISERLVRPSALTIDFLMNNRVYWADYKLGVIESMNYDGSERVLIRVNVFSPVSIDVFESKVYWVSQRNGSAHFADKFGFGNASSLQTSLLYPSGVRIFHRLRMDLEIKPRCPRKGEICSHLCLLRPEGYSCACPDGSAFQKDSSFICDAASEVSKPIPAMCACWNGGECVKLEKASYICKCLQGYSGNLCEIVEPKKLIGEHKLPDLIAIVVPSAVVFAICVAVLVIVLVVVCRRKRKEKSGSAAVYVSEEHVAAYPVPQTSSVEGQQGFISTNFSNPVYETCHGEDPNLFVRGVQAISAHDDDSEHYASAGSVSTIPPCLADSVETFYKRPTLHVPDDDISDYITAGEPKYINNVDCDEPRHIDVSGAEPRHLDPADDYSGADTAVLVRQNIAGVHSEEHSV